MGAKTNTTTNVVPQLLAQGLLALRQMAVMPRYVNRAYEATAGEKGSSIDVPIPSAIVAQAVSPSYVAPDDVGVSPTNVNIPLSEWYEAPFFLNDKEMLEVQSGTIPMQATEAVKALANNVDSAILALYKSVYGYAGVAGATPFANDLAEFLDARKTLNNQLAPTDPRFVMIDPDAEANALGLRAFQDAAFRGDRDGILNGQIGFKLGSTWFMDQNAPTHTAGTGVGLTLDNTDMVAGVATATLAAAGAGTLVTGDVFTFGDDTSGQTYVYTGTGASSAGGAITFAPVLQTSWTSNNSTVTIKATHAVNLAFHRDAFAFASRPFAGADPMGLGVFQSAVDPVSGLTLRLEVSRQYKRTRFAYDILYGVKCIRPELACRIAG
jgi:hypothetical protein